MLAAVPPLVYEIAGGAFVVPAVAVLAAAIVAGRFVRSRGFALGWLAVGVLATATVVVSSTALPWWGDVAWAATVCACAVLDRSAGRTAARWRTPARVAALTCTVAAGVVELAYEHLAPLAPGHATTLCVIGNSVSAGLGRRGEATWPNLVRATHGVRVVDLSRAGCTLAQAVRTATPAATEPGVVVIEAGGNDTLGRASPARFAADLESLATLVDGGGRRVVMFELPRFPFDDAYGLEQRRVSRRHHILLVPRRSFTRVLASPGATTDGVHLSNVGQQRMADLVWRVVGPAMGG